MVAAPARPCVRFDLATCAAECRPTTWPISWASTPASCAFRSQVFQQALGDEYLPAGQRKGINGLVVGQQVELEFVGRLAGFGAGDNFLAHLLHGGRGAGVGAFAAILGGHFGRGLHAQGNFLRRRSCSRAGFRRSLHFWRY